MEKINKIPKRIHYCWFGGKEKPETVKKYLNNWKNKLPEYEIIEWNENNFNVGCNKYVREAYEAKKFAFVSDYARLYALYHQGGIYLDTDVEVFRSFDDLLFHESFWGFEQGDFIATSTIGAENGNKLIKFLLDSYQDKQFLMEDGSINTLTNVVMVSKIAESFGIRLSGKYQEIHTIGAFYPQTYFSPYDYINCRNHIKSYTYTVHHFEQSWLSPKDRVKSHLKLITSKIIGGDNIARIRKLVSRV